MKPVYITDNENGIQKRRYVSMAVTMAANMIREEINRNEFCGGTDEYIAGLTVALDYLHYCADINNIKWGNDYELL